MTGRGRGPWESLSVVWLASLLVPSGERDAWSREWRAELLTRWRQAEGKRSRLRLFRHACGSLVDAGQLRFRRGLFRGTGMELRVAARTLARRPLFSLLVVTTLGVGIGATATLYRAARDQLLRPFPYPEADKVVAVVGQDRGRTGLAGNVTYPNLADLDARSTTLDGIAAIRWWTPALTHEAGSTVLNGATVTANFFEVLGVDPAVGRFFEDDEEGTGRPPLVVLSHAFVEARYAGERSVVGQDVVLNGLAYRVIGVTGPDFEDPWLLGGPGSEPLLWRTVSSPPSEWPRSGRSWKGIGRVRADVGLEAAQSEITALMRGLEEAHPQENTGRSMELVPLRDRVAGPVRPAIVILLGSVGLLLMVSAANLAGLLLGRALERQREFTMRRALGASGWRIARGGMAEAGLLALLGGLSGLALTSVLGRLLGQFSASFLPRPLEVGLDADTLLFTAALTVGTGLFFGTLGRSGQRARRALVVVQLGLTTVLLTGSGLLARSLQRLGQVDLGVEVRGVLTMQLHGSAWWELDAEAAQYQWDEVLAAVRSVPGVEAAGAMDYVPLGGDYSCDGFGRADRPRPSPGEGRCAEVRSLLPGALEALGVPLVRGRHLSPDDREATPAVAVVDQRLASAVWPGEDPVGKAVFVHGAVHEVVGVVADMRHFGPAGTPRPMLYLSAPQEGWNGITRGLWLVVRSPRDPEALAFDLREAVASTNPEIAVGAVDTLSGLLRENLAAPRFRALLLALFAGAALILALLGVGGVMAFSVARRTRGLGGRLALGARPDDVRRLVLREGLRLTAGGVALGVLAAGLMARFAATLLFEIGAGDPVAFATSVGLVTGLALVSCYVPARRASSVDPVEALSAP